MAPPSSLRWIKHFVGKCSSEQAHLRQQVSRFEHSGERLHITQACERSQQQERQC